MTGHIPYDRRKITRNDLERIINQVHADFWKEIRRLEDRIAELEKI